MIITFAGHSSLAGCENLFQKINNAIKSIVQDEEQIKFYCGGYGDFDSLCASVCRSIKNDFKECELVFVTPYYTPSQQHKIKYLIDSKLYDSTVYPPLESVPAKYAIIKRNEWMIDNADVLIAYVKNTNGGAYKTLQYARRKNKKIINLAE